MNCHKMGRIWLSVVAHTRFKSRGGNVNDEQNAGISEFQNQEQLSLHRALEILQEREHPGGLLAVGWEFPTQPCQLGTPNSLEAPPAPPPCHVPSLLDIVT